MSKFCPNLKRHEIVEILDRYKIAEPFEADLNRKDPDYICNLYARIMFHLASNEESLDQHQMAFGAIELLENPEHHTTAIQRMEIFRKLQHILTAIRCPKEFNLKDLVNPEPDRTLHFVKALVNFVLHREQKLDLFQPHNDDIELLGERKSATEAGISQLNAEIAEIEESRELDSPFVREINSEIQKLQQTVSELNKHQAALKTSINKSKEKVKEVNEKISDADFSLHQSASENRSLHSKIVQSPEKLQRALEEKKSVQVNTENAERAAMQSFQEKSSALEAYAKACKKMTEHSAQLNAIQEQVNSAKSVEKDVKVFKSKLSDEGVLIKSLEVKLIEVQSKTDQLKEFKKQLEKEITADNDEASKDLNRVKSEAESKRCELELRQKQVKSIVAEVDVLSTNKRIVKEEGEAKMQELCRKARKITEEFYNYSKLMSDLLPTEEDFQRRS